MLDRDTKSSWNQLKNNSKRNVGFYRANKDNCANKRGSNMQTSPMKNKN